MRNYNAYVSDGGKRAFREALLFQLINDADHRYTPDGMPRGPGGEEIPNRVHLTLEQKRRLRNEVYRIGREMIDAHNAALPEGADESERWNDLDRASVFVNAFFQTDFGKKYASRQADWQEGGPMMGKIRNIAGWAQGSRKAPPTTLVSPYDPLFAASDAFGEDADQIGYFIGNVEVMDRVRHVPANLDVRKNPSYGKAENAPQYFRYIKAVQLGQGHDILPYNMQNARGIARATPYTAMEGDVTKSGYHVVEHYIRTNADRKAVRSFLLSEMSRQDPNAEPGPDGKRLVLGPVSEDEAKFMGDVCRYLSERGFEFTVKVSRDGNLVAALDSPKADVRILSRGDEMYQGRIYSNGKITRLGVDGANAEAINHQITSADRLDMIRWYFGETVPVHDERTGSARFNHNIGETRYRVNGIARGGAGVNTVSLGSSRSDMNSVLFGIKRRSDGKGVAPIQIITSTSGVAYAENRPETMFTDSMKLPGGMLREDPDTGLRAINSSELIPVQALLPGDWVPGVDEDGRPITIRCIGDNGPIDRNYYQKVLVREKLNGWVENAKANHAAMVDIQGLFEQYTGPYKLQPGTYTPEFSSDENVAEIQSAYWDVLVGGDGTDEERLADVRVRYAKYLEENFGSVRTVPMPLQTYEDTRAFSPTMTARYVNTEDSYGIQKNLAFIRNMLSELGDAYEPSMILGDDYTAANMRNDLVKFDPGSLKGDFTMGDIGAKPTGMDKTPFTRDMVAHVADTLSQTGCDPRSIRVRVDEKGVMEYTGYAPRKKSGASRKDYYDTVALYRQFQAAIGVPQERLAQFASFDEGRCLGKGLSAAEKEALDAMDPADYERFKDLKDSMEGLSRVHGYLGQIFEPDQYGAIKQDTVTEDSRIIVPGYTAHLVENDPEDPKPMRERLRLTGLEQQMRAAITMSIRDAVFTMDTEYNFDPHAAELNRVYRHSYETTLDESYYRRMLPGSDDPTISDEEKAFFAKVVETLRGRCRFPNEYGEGSTTMAQSYLEHPTEDLAQSFDYYYSDLCDNHNLRVLGPEFDYIFDPNMTGTAKTQGIVRYLCKGIIDGTMNDEVGPGVNADGTVTPVAKNAHADRKQCPLASDPLFATMRFNSWDRRQMSMSQSLTALGTPRGVGVAMITMAGENFDDGMQISKAFAEAHPIMGADGNMRPLMEQDKLSDASGNKGVISRVVDPSLHSETIARGLKFTTGVPYFAEEHDDCGRTIRERVVGPDGKATWEPRKHQVADVEFRGHTYAVPWSIDPAVRDRIAAHAIQKELGVYGRDEVMAFFRDNPNVDVTMAPYSGMSRTNGSIVRDMMDSPGDLVLDGKVIEGGMGHTNLIIVDMPADVKTHWYDEDAIKAGKGRKASGQLAWALQAKGCKAIMQEFYGDNQSSLDDMREYMISLGLDMDATSRPVVGYQEQTHRGEKRNLIKLPDMSGEPEDGAYTQLLSPAKGDEPARRGFAGYIDQGRMNTKRKPDVRLLKDYYVEQSAVFMEAINKKGGFFELPFQLSFNTQNYVNLGEIVSDGMKDKFLLQPTGQTYKMPDGTERPTYGMPVLPTGLRSGQEFQDGSTMVHDFTNRYMQIHKAALTYMACERQLAGETDDTARAMLEKAMSSAKGEAQGAFDAVTSKIAETRFNTKHNVIRDGIMSSRLDKSATAVWSADPRLNLDEVSMTIDHARMLGLCDKETGELEKDARVLLWRDPILHDDNVRYLKVVIDKDVLGVRINPLIDKAFDGDFDGDSIGMARLRGKAARNEAYSAFAMETNLLQKGVVDENGMHPLYIQTGLDVAAMCHARPELKAQLDRITLEVNELERKAAAFKADPSEENAAAISVRTKVRDKATGSMVEQEITGQSAINVLRKRYKNELDVWAHECLSGVGTSHIVVKDPKTVVESVQAIVDCGAKGNMSKMRDYMDNLGIDYECEKDEKGKDVRAIIDTVRNITDAKGNLVTRDMKEGKARQVDMAIQETAAYKADNTSLGGTTAQEGVSAFRDVDLVMALELTYPITQAILQSKHDPKDAKAKDEIVRFWGRDVWNGYKLSGDFTGSPEEILKSPHAREIMYVAADGKRIPWSGDPATLARSHDLVQKQKRVPEVNEDGEQLYDGDGKARYTYVGMTDSKGNPVYEQAYVKCTPEEWKTQMLGMMKALKVDINPEYVDRMATAMRRGKDDVAPLKSAVDGVQIRVGGKGDRRTLTEVPGTIIGLSDFATEKGTLMDRVAYSGKLSALVKSALCSDPDYQEAMAGKGRGHELALGSTDAILGRAGKLPTAKRDVELAQGDATLMAKLAKAAGDMESGLDNTGAFAPNQFRQESDGDAARKGTDKVTNTVSRKRFKEIVTVEVAPRPIGSRGCRLTKDEYEAGAACMGEPQAAYAARLGGAIPENAMFVRAQEGNPVPPNGKQSGPAVSTVNDAFGTRTEQPTREESEQKLQEALRNMGVGADGQPVAAGAYADNPFAIPGA